MAIEPPDISETAIGQLTQLLGGIHTMLALGLQSPELQLSENESALLAKHLAGVGKYYIKLEGSNKFAAWIALMITVGMIYVPRIMAIQRRNRPPSTSPDVSPRRDNSPDNVAEGLVQ